MKHSSNGHDALPILCPLDEPWLGRPLVRLTWRPLAKGAILRITCDLLSFARPLLMQQILLICEGSPAIVSREHAYYLAIAMAAASLLQMFLNTHYGQPVSVR